MRISRKDAVAMGIEIGKAHGKVKKVYKKIDPELFDAMCLANGIHPPVHEFEFAAEIGRRFKADYCFDAWLLVENQGGIYGIGEHCHECGRRAVGAHSSIKDMKRDIERQRVAVKLGYAIIHCLPDEIVDGSIFPIIKEILESREEQP